MSERADNQTSGVNWFSGSDTKVPQTPPPLRIVNSGSTNTPVAPAAITGTGILNTGGGTLRTPGGTPTTAFVPTLQVSTPGGGPGSVLNTRTGVFGGITSAIKEGAIGSQSQIGFTRSGPTGSLTNPTVAVQRPFANGSTSTSTSNNSTAGTTTGGEGQKAWFNQDLGESVGLPGADTSQREIPCPNCTGSFLVKYAGRLFSSLTGWIQKTFNIRVSIISTIKNYVIERLPVTKRAAFQGGQCPVCGSKGTITDPSDDRAKYAQSASIAQGYAKEIEENEAKLGTGGNEYKIVAGHSVTEVGIGMNDAPSYRVDYDKGYRLKGMADWGKGGIDPKYGPIPEGGTKNHVQGINPIASPGGQYTIKCSNKFCVLTGALGVEIVTGGPVTIKGGITRITGPEVTIGTQTGTLGLEGQVVSINGDSIEMGAKNGQVIVKGSGGYTGNVTVGGHLHAESASVVKLETVGRNEPSKVSASSNLYSGPAFWGGTNTEGLEAALQELLAFVLTHVTNPEMAKHIVSLRYTDGLLDNEVNLAYMLLPQELVQTGWAVIGPGVIAGITTPLRIPVFNFPHTHAQFDQDHYHETRIPDIECSADDARELRSKQVGLKSPAPIHKKSTSILDVARSIWEVISLPFIAIWYPFTKNIQNKGSVA